MKKGLRWVPVVLVLTLCVQAAPSQAQSSWGYHEPVPLSARSYQPSLALRLSAMSGIPDLLGISLTLHALEPLVLEAGVSTLGLGVTAYGRVGGAIPLLRRRDPWGRGWTSSFLLMAGYRYISGVIWSTTISHAVTATASINATYWFVPRFGLQFALDAGGGYIFKQDNRSSDPPDFYPELRLSVGVAF